MKLLCHYAFCVRIVQVSKVHCRMAEYQSVKKLRAKAHHCTAVNGTKDETKEQKAVCDTDQYIHQKLFHQRVLVLLFYDPAITIMNRVITTFCNHYTFASNQ